MSFLFESNTPLTTVESIRVAIKDILGSTSCKKDLGNALEKICIDELQKSNQVSWEFILESLVVFVDNNHLDPQIYNEIISNQKSNEEAYHCEGIYRHSLFWPNPNAKGGFSRYGVLPIARQEKLFDKSTRLASIGSCFANEVTKRLLRDGFNYLRLETDSPCEAQHSFSANWGIVFNPLAFNQAVKYYLNRLERPAICWSSKHSGKLRYYDPFREDVSYSSLQDHESDIERHRKAGRDALLKADVIFLTLGLTEVWQLRSSKLALARAPYKINPLVGEYRSLDVHEIIDLVNEAVSIIKSENPDVQIIATVSPVPLAASFRKGHHAIESNFLSKSKLRVAIESVAESNEYVYYFPSYEITMFCHTNPWASDERHISETAVDMVFKALYMMYGPDQNNHSFTNQISSFLGVATDKKRHRLTILSKKIINYIRSKIFDL